MKKLLILLLALMLTGCAAQPLSSAVTALPEEVIPPQPDAPDSLAYACEATLISPPCMLTICRTMDRPRPVPPVARERALSTR